jgi:Leucine-rich repeat (LRR) protein
MKKWHVLFWLIWFSKLLSAQHTPVFYRWDQVRNASPDTIFYISLAHSKLTQLPDSLARFSYLKGLDISRNQLTELPMFISAFDSLFYLNIARNKYAIFPIVICRLTGLKQLIMNRNQFDELPDCVRYLQQLEYLDLWSTPIRKFPSGFNELKQLKTLDLQGNRYSPSFQRKLKANFPNTQVLLDAPCDCME